MKLIETLKAAAEAREEALKAATEKAREVVTPGLKDFMETHPELVAISWTQYTPYFNDGDTCEFGVNDVYFTNDPEMLNEHVYDWDYHWGAKDDKYSESTLADLKELGKALCNADQELLALFGDHVRVIVTKDGIEVEEYIHD